MARGRVAWRAGRWAETLAAWRLRLAGWRIVARGWRTGRGTGAGEIDLIARRGRVLAFVEVKARGDGDPTGEALGPTQRRRLARAAQVFLARHPLAPAEMARFDVIRVGPGWRVRHLPDAWRPDA
ncbi:YraN family protein [Pararhodospirillum oryzae]|nr:YraN family protein [Pararhodospirillum oryzae]